MEVVEFGFEADSNATEASGCGRCAAV